MHYPITNYFVQSSDTAAKCGCCGKMKSRPTISSRIKRPSPHQYQPPPVENENDVLAAPLGQGVFSRTTVQRNELMWKATSYFVHAIIIITRLHRFCDYKNGTTGH